MVKVIIDIEKAVHKKGRKEAIDRGVTFKAYLEQMIKEGIEKGGKKDA